MMIKSIFVLCFVAAFAASVFGQTLDEDLRRHFNKYSVVRINDREALAMARSRTPFNIRADDRNFQFILRFNDVRTEDYRAEYTDRDGRHALPRGEVFTYKSTLIGERNSVVALTVDGTKTEGYLAVENEGYFMESARKYSSHARDDDKVIYQVRDKVKQDDDIYNLDEIVEMGIKVVGSNADLDDPIIPSGRKILRVATEADSQFVLSPILGNGDPATANAHILSVMNQVDAVFELQLNISIAVTFQHTWASATVDPYEGIGNADQLINAFENYWNNNFPSSNPNYRRDVGHLFTLRTIPGIAKGIVCGAINPYSITSSPSIYKWVITAHELGHNLTATHINQQFNCEFTIMQADAPPDATKFCAYSVEQITYYVERYGGCLGEEPPAWTRTLFDFDADGEADLSVFRPSDTFWYLQQSTAGFTATAFGLATDKLSPADYDGDGKTDIAVFRDGNWHVQRSSSGFISISFGASGDIPVPSDFTGDGKAELVVFRPSNGYWYTYDLTNNQIGALAFGQSGDKPQIGDFDGDGKADYALFRPSTGEWRIQQSSQGFYSASFGSSTDEIVPADYDNDNKTDIAVFRPSNGTWYLQRSTLGFAAVPFGQSGDVPNPADYDADGKVDVSVFRPSTGTWHRINSSTNATVSIAFGQNSDIPIPSFRIVQ